MKGRSRFTDAEAARIRQLLRARVGVPRTQQKRVRDELRGMGFYISDWWHELTSEDFDRLIARGSIEIAGGSALPPAVRVGGAQASPGAHDDESYVIDLCDNVLGEKASRQHRFDFLRGDSGVQLPVDAYYASLHLVVEYRERQHTEDVPFFDRRHTVSGVPRGEQRALYDERRRQLLPQQGIALVELSYTDFPHDNRKRLLRETEADAEVVRQRLAQWLKRPP